MKTKAVEISDDQIVVNRQSLLYVVRALDIGSDVTDISSHLDSLREPFFEDEIVTGNARKDFSVNSYNPDPRDLELADMNSAIDLASE